MANNRVFIGWSGKTNREIAKKVKDHLVSSGFPTVIGGEWQASFTVSDDIIHQMNGCDFAIILIEKDDSIDEDTLMMEALDAGADDFASEDGIFEITTTPEGFSAVREALEANYTLASAEVEMVPQTTVDLTDADDIKFMNKLLEMLEDNDDVQNVYTTMQP